MLVIWLPVVIYFILTAVANSVAGAFPIYIRAVFVLGLLVDVRRIHAAPVRVSLSSPRTVAGTHRLSLHGIHHVQPQCKTRLVMPPVVSVPLSFLFYGLCYLIAGRAVRERRIGSRRCFAGLLTGYVCYDMTHYATHHFPMRWGFWKCLEALPHVASLQDTGGAIRRQFAAVGYCFPYHAGRVMSTSIIQRGQRLRADLTLLLVAAVWGSAFVVCHLAAAQTGSFLYNGARFLVGVLALLPLVGARLRGLARIEVWGGALAGAMLFVASGLQQMGLAVHNGGQGRLYHRPVCRACAAVRRVGMAAMAARVNVGRIAFGGDGTLYA